jgi:UDP-glucose 4-epimerase
LSDCVLPETSCLRLSTDDFLRPRLYVVVQAEGPPKTVILAAFVEGLRRNRNNWLWRAYDGQDLYDSYRLRDSSRVCCVAAGLCSPVGQAGCENGSIMKECYDRHAQTVFMSVLVTGGAGFIGSHSAKVLVEAGLSVVVLDNLTTGRRENSRWGSFVSGDISNIGLLRQIIRDYAINSVLHLAAMAHVGESMVLPGTYFYNNVCGTIALLDALVSEGVRQLVFASSCSVYGNTDLSRVCENQALHPLSPYGESKLFIERALPWYERAHGLHWLALRYFNVGGAASGLGEPQGSARIVPRAIHAALTGAHPIRIFGTQYPTCDGTAVRDYVHVLDVARANLLALQYVAEGKPGAVVNIGTGNGVSVRQIVDVVGCIAGRAVPFSEGPPRLGDGVSLIADAAKARALLGWVPSQSDLTRIVTTAVASYLSRANAEDPSAPAPSSP